MRYISSWSRWSETSDSIPVSIQSEINR
jgi:hypothetical protein